MLNKIEFIEYIKNIFSSYLPDGLNDVPVVIGKTASSGGSYNSLTLDSAGNAMPVLDLDRCYANYCIGEDSIAEITKEAADRYLYAISESSPLMERISDLENPDYEKIKDNIFIRLTDMNNRELLENNVHITKAPYSATFRIKIGESSDQVCSAGISNHMFEKFGITKEQLLKDSLENLNRDNPPVLTEMGVNFLNIFDRQSAENLLTSDRVYSHEDGLNMFVLSGIDAYNAAAFIFDEQVMQKASESLGGDFYILPSSIHNVIFINIEQTLNDSKQLENMVKEINATQVSREDKLSDRIAYFDSSAGQFIRPNIIQDEQINLNKRMEQKHKPTL